MANVRMGIPFVRKGFEDETLVIISADVSKDVLHIQAVRKIDNEVWETHRKMSYKEVKIYFENGYYKYID
jgi:hypothetical protein